MQTGEDEDIERASIAATVRLLIVDLSALFWWFWHSTAKAAHTEAYELCMGKVVSLAEGYDRAVIACDSGRTFRHELTAGLIHQYKANRPEKDDAAIALLGEVVEGLERRGYVLMRAEGYEADDVIASLVRWAEERSWSTTIAGSDKDLEQLISPQTLMLKVAKNVVMDVAAVHLKYGLEPTQLRDFLALVGDSADNIKGCPGIGEKKASELLKRFGSIAGLRKALDDKANPLTGVPLGVIHRLYDGAEQIDLAVQLVTLRSDLELDFQRLLRGALTSEPRGDPPIVEAASLPVAGANVPRDREPPRELPQPTERTKSMTQQAPSLPAKPNPFSLAAVTTARDHSPHKGIIMGRSGVGKTHLVSTFPHVFLLHIEDGLKGVSQDHAPAHFPGAPQTFDELMTALRVFAREVNARVDGKRPYRHLAVDSLTGIEVLVHAAAMGVARVEDMEGLDYKKVWAKAEPFWMQVRRAFDAIKDGGVNVWIIAHSAEVFESNGTDGSTYKKWDLLLKGSNDTGVQIRNFWRGWADHVLFVDWATTIAKSKGKRAIAKFAGRVLYTRETGTHFAKSRGGLPPTLPATWTDLAAALQRASAAPEARVRQQLAEVLGELGDEGAQLIRAELAGAKTTHALEALLSRAQGMLAVEREDAPEELEPQEGAAAE